MSTEIQASGPRFNPAVRAMVSTLFFDIGLSVIAYFVAELLGASNYLALLAGTVVAGLRVTWVALRQRRLDPFALFLLVMFGGSLAVTFVTGDARFMLVKDSAQSFIAGLVLVGSCVIGRPLAYYAARRFARAGGQSQQDEFEATAHSATMRARWFRVSLVWGIGLLSDACLRAVVVYTLPIGVAANISQVLMIVIDGLLVLWTAVTMVREQSALKAERAERS
jgi:hypothetical protein